MNIRLKCVGVSCICLGLAGPVACRGDTPAPPAGGGNTNNVLLNSWGFEDTNWLSSAGYGPVSWGGVACVPGPDGNCLLVDSTNAAAWLHYNVIDASTNVNLSLTNGSILLWFCPDWSGTNAGGSGPGDFAPLVEVGEFTAGANYGAWGLRIDPSGTSVAFEAEDGQGTHLTCLTAPVRFTAGVWHCLALTYGTATNGSAFYLDGLLLTNGLGVGALPSAAVIAGGFYVGSDTNGTSQQARGRIDDLATYNWQLDAGTIGGGYLMALLLYGAQMSLASAPSYPTNNPGFDAVSGPGYLTLVATNSGCAYNSNVWFQSVGAAVVTNGATANVTVTLSLGGGEPNTFYDLFGTVRFQGTNTQWAWLGQLTNCSTWALSNQINASEFFRLGNTNDANGDGVRDAVAELVVGTDPYSVSSDGYGTPNAWYAMHGLNLRTQPANADTDQDGLLNWQEYQWGTDPRIPEGFRVWVGLQSNATGIP